MQKKFKTIFLNFSIIIIIIIVIIIIKFSINNKYLIIIGKNNKFK